MIKNLLLIAACAAALSACAATTTSTSSSSTTIAVTQTPTRGDQVVNTVAYDCEGGTGNLTVSFNDTAGNVTVTPKGGAAVTLPQHKTSDASFDYSDSSHALRGKHDVATWTVGSKTVKCKTG